MLNVFIGYEPRFQKAFEVAERSLYATHTGHNLNVRGVALKPLQDAGFYTRPMERKNGILYDTISEAPMSTEFAISRFYVPFMMHYNGWALFCDSDFLFRADVEEVFEQADSKYAVMCVKHNYSPNEATKMDGQVQTLYKRKNWSSFMLFNCGHAANRQIDLTRLNKATGRELHQFSWLLEGEIGEIKEEWNWLEGHSSQDINPKAVHFTRGTPDVEGFENIPYADEWREYANR